MSQAGEEEVLAGFLPFLPQGDRTLLGPGDDAAVARLADSRVVVSTDTMIEGVHFRLDWSDGWAVGWRLGARNLADIAAMGARPVAFVAALAGPRELLTGPWTRDFARGLGQYCARWGVDVVGGDLSSAPLVAACGTALGDLPDGSSPITRAGARVGDTLALRGPDRASSADPSGLGLGASAAGLAYLSSRGAGAGPLDPDSSAGAGGAAGAEAGRDGRDCGVAGGAVAGAGGALGAGPGRGGRDCGAAVGMGAAGDGIGRLVLAAVRAFLTPDPAIDQGVAAAKAGATALIDISDGLLKDAGRMARASLTRLEIDGDAAALASAWSRLAPLAEALGRDAWEWVLSGGEDHALLATFPEDARLPEGWRAIGRVVTPGERGPGVDLVWKQELPGGPGATAAPRLRDFGSGPLVRGGWDHFIGPDDGAGATAR
ncbi:MAG: thiamine-phosphate kinase [Bifidobacteriaceae bacterium]|jgi:thiamine-monophosphate kinase|nr:thiamine-phosphate kinase [Bifidobacteriaceae bacterium]